MKFIVGVFLMLALLDVFHCAPLINRGDENGYHKERHSSNQWGRHFGVGLELGFKAGLENGMARVQSNNHLDFDVGGYNNDNSQEFFYPTGFNSGYQYYGSPYGIYGPAPYYPQYYPQYPIQARPTQEINEENQYK